MVRGGGATRHGVAGRAHEHGRQGALPSRHGGDRAQALLRRRVGDSADGGVHVKLVAGRV